MTAKDAKFAKETRSVPALGVLGELGG